MCICEGLLARTRRVNRVGVPPAVSAASVVLGEGLHLRAVLHQKLHLLHQPLCGTAE